MRSSSYRLGRFLTLGVVVASAVLLVPSSSRAADIYSSEDANGVISFTNTHKKGKLYARVPSPSRAAGDPVSVGTTRYDEYIRGAAGLYQIPQELVRAVIRVESGFDPRATSRTNARGLMQLMAPTAERMMVTDVFDPRQNIFGGVRYLRVLANLFNGDIELTLAGYNAGENAVIQHGGIPPFEETRQYVVKVMEYYRYYRESSSNPARRP
ncbi:MAG TPA: lytic transglycosylase domain-containing protein [Polyangiaceae bacterium]